MVKVNEYVEMLKKEVTAQLRQQIKTDQNAYKTLLKDLLIQGLIKLMEGQIFIRCRQKDKALIESV